MGTWPVFMTAISTILGAILFLRFGYSVAHAGLLGYIIMGHPDWKKAEIKIFSLYRHGELEDKEQRLLSLIKAGRLPISPNNVNLIEEGEDKNYKEVINSKSQDSDLTIIGFNDPDLERNSEKNV